MELWNTTYNWLIDFNAMSNYLVLFYAYRLVDCIHHTHLNFKSSFLKVFFAHSPIKY